MSALWYELVNFNWVNFHCNDTLTALYISQQHPPSLQYGRVDTFLPYRDDVRITKK